MATNTRPPGNDKYVATRRSFLRGAAIAGVTLAAMPAARGGADDAASQERADERTILAFWDAWNAKCEDLIMSFFTADATYHNIPVDPIVGMDAIRSTVQAFLQLFAKVNIETISTAAKNGVVHTERVDHFTLGPGKIVKLPVAGVLYLTRGKIRLWRDYFDLASFERQSGVSL